MTVSYAVPDAGTSLLGTSTLGTSLLGMPSGHLSLRIQGTERDGQIVRIRSPKCSIGSAPHCTLRLLTRGVRPVHCIILRGPKQTVVRRWSPDTRLNGGTFTDAVLRPGDRLGIGPLEFEVLGGAPVEEPLRDVLVPREPDVAEPAQADEPATSDSIDVDVAARIDGLEQQVSRTRSVGHNRVRRLLTQLRETKQQADSHREEREEQLEAESDELRRQAETELATRESEIARQEEQLDTERRTLEAESAELRRQAETELATRESEIMRQEEQLESERRTLESESAELRRQAETELAARESEIARQEEQLEAECRTLEAESAELRRQRHEFEDDLAAVAEPQANEVPDTPFRQTDEEPERDAADDAADTIESFVNDLESREGRDAPEENEPSAPSADEQPFEAASEPEGVEEDSIQQYMAKLLQRMGGSSCSDDRPKWQPEPASTEQDSAATFLPSAINDASDVGTRAADVTVADATCRPVEPACPAEEPNTPAATGPVRLAPELTSDLAAMREVANMSARSAIDRHARRRWRHAAIGKLMVAGVAAGTGGFLLYFRDGAQSVGYLGAWLSFLVAIFWGLQSAILMRHVAIVSRPSAKQPPETREDTPADGASDENR